MAVSLIEKVSYVTWNQEMVNHVFFGANCIEEITRKVELGCCLLRAIEPKSFKVIVVVDFQPCQDHDTYHAASEVPEVANPYSASKCIMPTSSTWAQEESLGFRPVTPPEPWPNGAFQTTQRLQHPEQMPSPMTSTPTPSTDQKRDFRKLRNRLLTLVSLHAPGVAQLR